MKFEIAAARALQLDEWITCPLLDAKYLRFDRKFARWVTPEGDTYHICADLYESEWEIYQGPDIVVETPVVKKYKVSFLTCPKCECVMWPFQELKLEKDKDGLVIRCPKHDTILGCLEEVEE